MSSKEWKRYKFSDILQIPLKNGVNKPTKVRGAGYKMINMGELFANPIIQDIETDRVPMTGRELENSLLQVGDLLFARQSLTVEGAGKCSLFLGNDEPYTFEGHLIRARVNQEIASPQYVYYYFTSRIGKSKIETLVHVTAAAGIRSSDLSNLEIDLPPIPTQRRIADILSALDEKIDLNRQTNASLEAIAQAIFKEWFVDFNFPGATGELIESELGPIPSGWRAGKLGDGCRNIRKGVHPKDIASDTPYVGLEHIPRKSLGLASWGFSEDVDSQKTHFQKYDVLFGKLRPYFHKVCVAPVDGICSTDILVIQPNQHDYFSFCLNHLFSDELITYVSSIADGTRMPRVDWNSISNYQILIPSHELLKEFTETTFSFYDSIIQNNQESATLAALRDNLLPKLMNGEIPV